MIDISNKNPETDSFKLGFTGPEWAYIQNALSDGLTISEAVDGLYPTLYRWDWTISEGVLTAKPYPPALRQMGHPSA